MLDDQPRFDAERNLIELGGRRLIFHCHHYNLFLQQTIEDALQADGPPVQILAATEAARGILGELLPEGGAVSQVDRLAQARALFASLGFGAADVSALSQEGGSVRLVTSHYAIGWQAKFGVSRRPICYFAVGYWAAALAIACGLNQERVQGKERECAATGAPACVIHLEVF